MHAGSVQELQGTPWTKREPTFTLTPSCCQVRVRHAAAAAMLIVPNSALATLVVALLHTMLGTQC